MIYKYFITIHSREIADRILRARPRVGPRPCPFSVKVAINASFCDYQVTLAVLKICQ